MEPLPICNSCGRARKNVRLTGSMRLMCRGCARITVCEDCGEKIKPEETFGDLRYSPARCLGCYEEHKYRDGAER